MKYVRNNKRCAGETRGHAHQGGDRNKPVGGLIFTTVGMNKDI
jgi:hypothetical protein